MKKGLIIKGADFSQNKISSTGETDWSENGTLRGQDGFSPTATVSKSGDTATITITDKNGTTTTTIRDGQNGQNGSNGQDGFSPTASVSKSGNTATITITDQSGTTTTTIQDGQDGVSPSVSITQITGGHRVSISDAVHPQGQSFDVMDGGISDAPVDGKTYVRKDAEWIENDSPVKQEKRSSNLLNRADGVVGYTISNNGSYIQIQAGGDAWVLLKEIPVNGATVLTLGKNGTIGDSNVYNYAFYDENKGYVAGSYSFTHNTTVETINVPSSAVYLSITYRNNFNTLLHQLNVGNQIQAYEAYYSPYYISGEDKDSKKWRFKADLTDDELLRLMGSQSLGRNVIRVGKTGDSDYNEIQSAIDAIVDDSVNNRYVILVFPGIYSRVSMVGTNRRVRYVSILGVDKRSCVVKDTTGNYDTPPLACLMDGTVANISFIMESDSESYNPGSSTMAYAMHSDWAGARKTIYKNCYFESNTGPAVGLGLHTDVTLQFEDCEFIRKAFQGDDNGGVFAHSGTGDAPNQWYIFRRCVAYNYANAESQGFRFRFVSGSVAGNCHVVVQNCGSFNATTAAAYINGDMLDYSSWGNNCAELNYSQTVGES